MRTSYSHPVISLVLVLFLLFPSLVCRADETPGKSNPPKPLRIWSPKPASATALPVLLFQHGFSAQTIYYSRLLSRVASHGFIVVAPQMYPITTTTNAIPEILWLRSHLSSTLTPSPLFFSLSPSPFLLSHSKMYPITTTTNAIPEIRASARVISWLRSHLSSTLSNRFKLLASPDWSKFAIAGHSRGGAVCFALLRQLIVPSPVLLKAVVLLDPVDGNPNGTRPLRIWSPKPSTATALPVLLFQHGFSAQTSFYSQLLTRIAKHGYIVVAPQVCGCVHSVYRWVGMGLVRWLSVHLVLIFQHGYSQLLTRMAKHGYIFVALQVCFVLRYPFLALRFVTT
ncbi:unnamed protein product [Closterium sp. Naga37s-1]|nr:unnamed protein product [Closterium sp. Naga37s-1]